MAGEYYRKKIEKHEEYLHVFAKALNHAHQTNYPERFWKIVMIEAIGSAIRPELIVKGKPMKPVVLSTKEKAINLVRNVAKRVIRSGSRRSYVNTLRNAQYIAYSFSKGIDIAVNIQAHLPYYFPLFFRSDSTPRRRLIAYASSIENEYHRNALLAIEPLFVEKFKAVMASIPVFEAEIKEFHLPLMDHWYVNFTIGKYVTAGAKLFYYQHGGFYGEIENHPDHYNESEMADVFVTWGWKLRKNDHPSFSYKLENLKQRAAQQSPKSIEYDLFIPLPGINSTNQEHYLTKIKTIASQVDRSKYPNIAIRPRLKRKGVRSEEYHMLALLERITVVDERESILAQLMRSRAVIQLHHPTTNFLECITLNKPVFAITGESFIPTKIVKPFVESFTKGGVFHNNAQLLVDFLNESDIEVWWEEQGNAKHLNAFKEQFARLKSMD